MLPGKPVSQVGHCPFASPDCLELFVVPLKVHVAFDQNLLDFEDQADDVVGELGVMAMFLNQFGSLALGDLGRQLVQLGVRIILELGPGALVQEQFPVLSDDIAHCALNGERSLPE